MGYYTEQFQKIKNGSLKLEGNTRRRTVLKKGVVPDCLTLAVF